MKSPLKQIRGILPGTTDWGKQSEALKISSIIMSIAACTAILSFVVSGHIGILGLYQPTVPEPGYPIPLHIKGLHYFTELQARVYSISSMVSNVSLATLIVAIFVHTRLKSREDERVLRELSQKPGDQTDT